MVVNAAEPVAVVASVDSGDVPVPTETKVSEIERQNGSLLKLTSSGWSYGRYRNVRCCTYRTYYIYMMGLLIETIVGRLLFIFARQVSSLLFECFVSCLWMCSFIYVLKDFQ